ncbi:RNA polymerase II-associated factor 1, partial [Lecanoromycetidae sp. Uapishka_2]
MATQQARPASYHQDYIARIRYENALPPPPGAPKLLNIPTAGMKYFTSAAFSSRLAREQPLNIEADAELGMHIDLVGMPAIQAPLAIPPTHAKDKNLLRPLSELGKPAHAPGGYSFLRRTEYISSEQKARAEANANAAKAAAKSPAAPKARKPSDVSKEDPLVMLRGIIKGFDIANPSDTYSGPDNTTNMKGAIPTPAEKEAWNRPKHPTKTNVKMLDTYPLVPDLAAIPDSGAYLVTKFAGNPTAATEARDIRMDIGIINMRENQGAVDYEFFLPVDEAQMDNIMRKLDVNDPENNDPSLYTHKGERGATFRFEHLRTYEAGRRIDQPHQQYKEVALALHDRGSQEDLQQSGAYYYPIVSKIQLKPHRKKNLAQMGLASHAAEDEPREFDWMELCVTDPDDVEEAHRMAHREAMESADVEL